LQLGPQIDFLRQAVEKKFKESFDKKMDELKEYKAQEGKIRGLFKQLKELQAVRVAKDPAASLETKDRWDAIETFEA